MTFPLRCETLELRDVPATYLSGLDAPLAPFIGPFVPADQVQPLAGRSAGGTLPTSVAEPAGTRLLVAVGSDSDDGRVRVYDGATKAAVADFRPFPGFGGKVTVGQGDMTGDGIPDVIVGAGPGGGPHVRAFDGAELLAGRMTPLPGRAGSFFAYDQAFRGGVSLAVYDLNGDKAADLVTGAGPGGGPHVRAFDGKTGAELASFFAYHPGFPGGVEVTAGDLTGTGVPSIVTGAGPGGGPHVRTFTATGQPAAGPLASVFAYDPAFRGGVRVAAGDLTGDGRAELVTGAGPGGGSHVKVWDAATGGTLRSFFAFPGSSLNTADPGGYTGGVRVGVTAVDATGVASLLVSGSGTDGGGVDGTSAFYISDGSLYQMAKAIQSGLSMDTAFLTDAARGNQFEVTSGTIALAKSTNAGVRTYAQNDLIAEHTAFQARVAALLAARGQAAPPPAPQDVNTAAFLQSLPAARFDRVFASLAEDDHRRTAQRYMMEATSGMEADARSYAADTLPHIQEHGANARQLRVALGG